MIDGAGLDAPILELYEAFRAPVRFQPTDLRVAYRNDSLAALLQLLVRELAFGLSLTAIITSPAFGFAGIGLPVLAMSGFARGWGSLLPLRWYLQILVDQAERGAPVQASAVPLAILAGMTTAALVTGNTVTIASVGGAEVTTTPQGDVQGSQKTRGNCACIDFGLIRHSQRGLAFDGDGLM